MTIGNFLPFRGLLTQLSAQNASDQIGFVQTANANLDGLMNHPSMTRLHRSVLELFPWNGSSSAPIGDRLRWFRFEDDRGQTGLAMTFITPKSAYALFPRKEDPLAFRILQPGAGHFKSLYKALKLLPSAETLERVMHNDPNLRRDNLKLNYVHKDFLYASELPQDDVTRFARTVRMLEKGGIAPIPTIFPFGETFPYWIEERSGGVHLLVLALRRGMEYVLGRVTDQAGNYGGLSLEGASRLYPTAEAVLKDAPDLADELPAAACFGAGDPLHVGLDVEVRGQRLLKDASGKTVGWATIAGGGAESHHSDPISGLSAATSMGGRTYQQDGYYLAHFRSTDIAGGRDVRVFVGVDGLGGGEKGEMASSAAVQAIHAAIVRMLRDGKLLLAGDLFDLAREVLDYQTLRDEMDKGSGFARRRTPDTVISIAMVVDGEATIATAGDFLTLLCALGADGRPQVLGHTAVDSNNEHSIHNTLRRGQKRLYRVRLPKRSWLIAGSDGAIGGLAPGFKRFTSQQYRQSRMDAYPNQSLFHNLMEVLHHAPAHAIGHALHDASSGREEIPDGNGATYPTLDTITPEEDNWTAASLYWSGESVADSSTPLSIPEAYGALEPIYPPFQYVHEDGPYRLTFPTGMRHLYVSGKLDPQNRPTIVMADPKIASPHIRLERVIMKDADGNESERIYVEKIVGRGRVALLDENDKPITSLTRKGSRHEVKPGHVVRLSARSFFRIMPN